MAIFTGTVAPVENLTGDLLSIAGKASTINKEAFLATKRVDTAQLNSSISDVNTTINQSNIVLSDPKKPATMNSFRDERTSLSKKVTTQITKIEQANPVGSEFYEDGQKTIASINSRKDRQSALWASKELRLRVADETEKTSYYLSHNAPTIDSKHLADKAKDFKAKTNKDKQIVYAEYATQASKFISSEFKMNGNLYYDEVFGSRTVNGKQVAPTTEESATATVNLLNSFIDPSILKVSRDEKTGKLDYKFDKELGAEDRDKITTALKRVRQSLIRTGETNDYDRLNSMKILSQGNIKNELHGSIVGSPEQDAAMTYLETHMERYTDKQRIAVEGTINQYRATQSLQRSIVASLKINNVADVLNGTYSTRINGKDFTVTKAQIKAVVEYQSNKLAQDYTKEKNSDKKVELMSRMVAMSSANVVPDAVKNGLQLTQGDATQATIDGMQTTIDFMSTMGTSNADYLAQNNMTRDILTETQQRINDWKNDKSLSKDTEKVFLGKLSALLKRSGQGKIVTSPAVQASITSHFGTFKNRVYEGKNGESDVQISDVVQANITQSVAQLVSDLGYTRLDWGHYLAGNSFTTKNGRTQDDLNKSIRGLFYKGAWGTSNDTIAPKLTTSGDVIGKEQLNAFDESRQYAATALLASGKFGDIETVDGKIVGKVETRTVYLRGGLREKGDNSATVTEYYIGTKKIGYMYASDVNEIPSNTSNLDNWEWNVDADGRISFKSTGKYTSKNQARKNILRTLRGGN